MPNLNFDINYMSKTFLQNIIYDKKVYTQDNIFGKMLGGKMFY